MAQILFITGLVSNINKYLYSSINTLIKDGFTVDVAAELDVDLSQNIMINDIRHNKINFSSSKGFFKGKALEREIELLYRKENYSIVIVHDYTIALAARKVLGREKTQIIYIADEVGLITFEEHYGKLTDRVIAVTKSSYDKLKGITLRMNGEVLRQYGYGVSKSKFENLDKSKRKYGFKEIEFVFSIIKKVKYSKEDIIIFEAIKNLQELYTNIKFIEVNLEDETYLSEINMSDTFIFNSKSEEDLQVLINSAIMEKPIIALRNRVSEEIVENYKNGIFINVENLTEVIESLRRIYLDNALRINFRKFSKEIGARYLEENVMDDFLKVVKGIIPQV